MGKAGRQLAILAALLLSCGPPITHLNVPYDARFGPSTQLDLYLPDDGRADRPAVMLVHGGGWVEGAKENYAQTAERLARSGYVAATINYRLAPAARYPAAIKDAWCALGFLRAHADEYGLDPQRLAANGYSAGGHLVAMLGLSEGVSAVAPDCEAPATRAPNAVIDGAGASDFERMPEAEPILQFFGGPRAEHAEAYRAASPLTYVRAGAPPFLLIHGTADWYIDVSQAVRLRDALEETGAHAELLTLEKGGHLANPSPNLGGTILEISTDSPEGWTATVDFLDRTLGAPEGR